jgi:D-cysteine desulfhydrase family pyridoxal phosphate-dependent enzyme
VLGRLQELPRVRLAAVPTPLEELAVLSRELGGPRLLVKREDLTGFAMGGSKVRKLELILGEAAAQGADTLVVSGDYQSNLSRMVAAAAGRLSARAVLVLGGEPHESRNPTGNLLLDTLAGAEVRWFTGDFREGHAESLRVADELRASGARPYVIPLGGSGALGACGYVSACQEILAQSSRLDALIVPVGSGGTMAGLVLGAKLLQAPFRIVGLSVSRSASYVRERVAELANSAAELLGLPTRLSPAEIHADDRFLGPGFGILTDEARAATRQFARAEGLFLDPVYTAKAAAGLVHLVREGAFGPDQTVALLHTGGLPALFAYASEMLGAAGAMR